MDHRSPTAAHVSRHARPGAVIALPFLRCAILSLALGLPAGAQQPAAAPDLVLRLMFDDCLGFARDGAEPFDGVAAPAFDAADVRALRPYFPASARAFRLDGQPYLAFIGTDSGRRFCAVLQAVEDAPDGMQLDAAFIEAASDRAAGLGLVLDHRQDSYGRTDALWRQPQFQQDPTLGIVVSLSLGPAGSEMPHLMALGASAPALP
ncbi:MAG: hypothetical protein R3D63_11425 [Paracoccaceae bacterium]